MHARRGIMIACRSRHRKLLEDVDVAQGRIVQRLQLMPAVDTPRDVEPWEVASVGGEGADETDSEVVATGQV